MCQKKATHRKKAATRGATAKRGHKSKGPKSTRKPVRANSKTCRPAKAVHHRKAR